MFTHMYSSSSTPLVLCLDLPCSLWRAQDPEVQAAFQDVQKNPDNAAKYQNNPKVKRVMDKLAATMGGAGMGPGM